MKTLRSFFFLCLTLAACAPVQAQTTYAVGNWTVNAKQSKGLARLYNLANGGLVSQAMAAGTFINAGGSGYHVGDVLTIADSGTTVTAATLTVTGVDGLTGAVTSVAIASVGNYTSHQGGANHTTTVSPAGGSGAVLRVNFYIGIPDMLTRNGGILDTLATEKSQQFNGELRDALASAIDAATDTQLSNAASALGVTLPR